MQSVAEPEQEMVQILYTGDFADGTSAKLDEISKHLAESLGLSVEFLTGDTHYSRFAAEQEMRNERFKGWIAGIQKQVGDRMVTNIRRYEHGLIGYARRKAIKALRKGKKTCIRKNPRMKGLSSSARITWGSLADSGLGNTSLASLHSNCVLRN